MQVDYHSDIELITKYIVEIETEWDGKQCVLKMKQQDFQWRQMEWWGFYFELVSKQLLEESMQFPGDVYENTVFDLKQNINWDLKASNIENSNVILNDLQSMQSSIQEHGFHGEIIGLFEVEKDLDRSFQAWHTELKGGKSNYEKLKKSKSSRFRKTKVFLKKVLLVIIDEVNINMLKIMNQGKNSNNKPRKQKYIFDMNKLQLFEHFIINLDYRKLQ